MMSVMGLWSCSNDEMLPGGSDLQGHPVTLTLTVNRGDAQTRTELSENTQTGGLNDVWESGDKLTVYNAEGVKAGELIIGEGVGTDTGVFTGEVTATDGQHDFNLWYTDPEATGNVEADGKPIYFNSKKEIVVDLSKMPKYTSVKALSAMDILSKGVKLNIKGNNATVVENTTMQAHMAMARFSLSGLPSGKTGTLTISDKEGQVNNDGQHQTLYKQRLSLATSGQEGTVSRPEGIKVEEVKTDEDIYLAFIPGTYTLSFNIECDGVTYFYAFTQPTELKAGVYYNAFTKPEGGEEGKIDGVNIPLVAEKRPELHVHANFPDADPEEIIIYYDYDSDGKCYVDLTKGYTFVGSDGTQLPAAPSGYKFVGWTENDKVTSADAGITYNRGQGTRADIYAIWTVSTVDHSKNPLAKWAEANLTHAAGEGADITNKLESSKYNKGKLYQWGRNKGWTDYKEARGTYVKGEPSPYVITYPPEAIVGSGLGNEGFYLNDAGDEVNIADMYRIYEHEKENFSFTQDLWIMNGALTGNTGDYMYSDNTDTNWEERRQSNYYSNPLCPEGFRLPTSAEFAEILPQNELVSSSQTLSEMLSAHKAELRKNKDCTYGIKWEFDKDHNALVISAIVMDENSTQNDLESIDWTSANVVSRVFPMGGAIRSTVVNYRLQSFNGYVGYCEYYAMIMPLGESFFTSETYTDRWYGGRYWHEDKYWGAYIADKDITDYSDKYAGYWCSDKMAVEIVNRDGWMMTPTDIYGNKVAGAKTNPQTSKLRLTDLNLHNGYSVRCVKK